MRQIVLKLVCDQLELYIVPFRAMATHFVSILMFWQSFLDIQASFSSNIDEIWKTVDPKRCATRFGENSSDSRAEIYVLGMTHQGLVFCIFEEKSAADNDAPTTLESGQVPVPIVPRKNTP